MSGKHIVGIDEVGRGPWAGPLTAAAVVLPDGADIPHLKDSKQLTLSRRLHILKSIQCSATAIGIGWVSPEYIDEHGLTHSTSSCMLSALGQVKRLVGEDCRVLVDGNVDYLSGHAECETIIKGDQLQTSIAAASVVAKVLRDRFMYIQNDIIPGYGFDRHVGYGTKKHKEALLAKGPSTIHRKSFTPVKMAGNM